MVHGLLDNGIHAALDADRDVVEERPILACSSQKGSNQSLRVKSGKTVKLCGMEFWASVVVRNTVISVCLP